jgi:hypothetical protein
MTTERSLSDAEDNAEQEVRIGVIVTGSGFADDLGSRKTDTAEFGAEWLLSPVEMHVGRSGQTNALAKRALVEPTQPVNLSRLRSPPGLEGLFTAPNAFTRSANLERLADLIARIARDGLLS